MNKSRSLLIIGLYVILIAAVVAISFYFYQQNSRYNPIKALNAMPEAAKNYYLKGREYYYNKRYDEAIAEYKKSIDVRPTAEAYCESAVSYMEKEDFKTAIEYLKKAIELNPKYPKSEYAIAVCYSRINPPYVKLAKNHYKKAKKLGYQIPQWFEKWLYRISQ